MVLLAVFNCQVKKTREFTEGVRKKNSVISESNGGDNIGDKIYSKRGHLGCGELKVVAEFVDLVLINSALFNSEGVLNGSHENLIPFNECFPVAKPCINVEKAMAFGASKICILYCTLLDNLVIS